MSERTRPRPFDPHGERIRFEQIDALYRNATIGVLGALAAAFLIGPGLWRRALLACGCGCVGYHLLLVHAFRSALFPSARHSRGRWPTGGWAASRSVTFRPRGAVAIILASQI